MRYYYSGLPYSDSLYHHGINGMKWGQRRYQNPDGSLTALGRVHYGVGKAREKIGEGAKVVGRTGAKAAKRLGEGVARGVKTTLAKKLPFMLNEDELQKYRERAKAETAFYNDLGDKKAAKKRAKGEQFFKNLAKDVISSSTKTAATKLVNKWADEKLKTKAEREKEEFERKSRKQASQLRDNIYEYEESNRKERDAKASIDSEMRKYEKVAKDNKDKAEATKTKMDDANKKAEEARKDYDEKYKDYLRTFEEAKEASRYGLDDDARRLYKEAGELFTETVALSTKVSRYEDQANTHKAEHEIFIANERDARDRADMYKSQSDYMNDRINARSNMITSNRATIASLGGGKNK